MSKQVNHKGKFSHRGDTAQDRSKHWKNGKSSGKSEKPEKQEK